MRFLRVPGMRWPPQADGVLMPLQWHAFRNDRFWCPVGTVQNRPSREARPGRRDPGGEILAAIAAEKRRLGANSECRGRGCE